MTGPDKTADGTDVRTGAGVVRAATVVVAKNACSDRGANAMRRRIVQIRTTGVATEGLPADMMAELTPRGRTFGE